MKSLHTSPFFDGWLIAFAVPLIAAQIIVANGTYTFYSYMLPWQLAIAATIVMAAGIPLLEFAAIFERSDARYGYWAGMTFMLILEGLAQYYKSQAAFLSLIRGHIQSPDGVDLVSFAQQPIGRILPILYLAALSFVVVGLGYAVARRIRLIRVIVAQQKNEQSTISQLQIELAMNKQLVEEYKRKIEAARVWFQANQDELNELRARISLQDSQIEQPRLVDTEESARLEHARTLMRQGKSARDAARAIDMPYTTFLRRIR